MKGVKEDISNIQNTIKIAVKDNISNVMDDHRELEKRKMNLIVFGLPEISEGEQAQEWNIEQKVEKDIEEITKLITEELGVGISPRTGIINARRLGGFKKNSQNKPRPLRIEFKDLNAKRDVLTNAKKFRNSSLKVAKNIYINPDLTQKQRESDKKLRNEMWQQRDAGKNVIIRRGQIVEVDREVRKHRISQKAENSNENIEKDNVAEDLTSPKDD